MRVLAAAAEGALAGAALAAAEIAARAFGGRPLVFPAADLAAIALAGAAVGVVVAIAGRLLRRPLSAAGIGFGLGAGLLLWLPTITGGTLLDASRLGKSVLFGGATVLAAATLGHLLAVRVPWPRRARPFGVDVLVLALLAAPLFAPHLFGSGMAPGPSPTGPAATPSPNAAPPNVLLLTIDTLRGDRLGFMGHPRATSPHLDRLARRALVFERAVTPQPRTLPALACLMTGALPHTTGVRDNFHYTLGSESTTLAERLRAAGWVTGAVNSNPILSHDSGIYQGFDSANDRGDDWSRATLVRGVRRLATLAAMRTGDRDAVITRLAVDWLRARPAGRPYFLWVHYLAPHVPYEPAPPFDRSFDAAYEGEYARVFDYGEVSKGEMTYRNTLAPRTLEHVKHLYDGEAAPSDRAVGMLLAWMEEHGALENTIVAATADHGESLDEHGYYFNHGDFVYGPAVHVPLVVRDAGSERAPALRRETASLVDLAPSLLKLAGAATPDETEAPGSGTSAAARRRVDGVPFDSLPRPQFGDSDFCRFPDLNDRLGYLLPVEIAQSPENIPDWKEKWEEQAIRAKQRFVVAGDWKLVLSPHPQGDRLEPFDLAADPGESRNAAGARPEVAAELEVLLRDWMTRGEASGGAAGLRTLDEETIERMEALGYIGD